jgi:protein ImuB
MARLACLSLPALPLQILLRLHPDWKDQPMAVVAEDKTQGLIRYVNRAGAQAGVRPGWRYGTGLALVRNLHAGIVADEAVVAEITRLTARLQVLTPLVEPSPQEPGVFWLGADGMRRVYPALDVWAREILATLRQAGFTGDLAVGFTHFGTYAAARTRQGITVFAEPQSERNVARQAPLPRLGLPAEAVLQIEQLGVSTASEFAALPEAGLLERFGPEVHALHRLVRAALGPVAVPGQPPRTGDGLSVPCEPVLQPHPLREPVTQSILLEYSEGDLTALLFLIKSRLHVLLGLLASRRQGLIQLDVTLALEGNALDPQREQLLAVRPAASTLDPVLILDLVRLRLESLKLTQGVIGIALAARGGPVLMEQLRLFSEHPRRDLRAGERALARIRAEFGEAAVARAALKPGHLPEAQFAWLPMDRLAFPAVPVAPPPSPTPAILTPPQPAPSPPITGPLPFPTRGTARGKDESVARPVAAIAPPERGLVRRLYAKAPAMSLPGPVLREGIVLPGLPRGRVVRHLGPYTVSGGWWAKDVQRDYYFAETAQGELLWLFYDRKRKRWAVQGRVE